MTRRRRRSTLVAVGRQPLTPGQLSLREGQLRTITQVAHNAGWADRFGQPIGWGDLNPADLHRVASALPPGEAFVAVSEWTPLPCSKVHEHAVWVVTDGNIYRRSPSGHRRGVTEDFSDGFDGKFTWLSQQDIKRLLSGCLWPV